MNLLRSKLIAYELDYHWFFLRKYKKEMLKLFEQGVNLSDEKMLSVNEKFNHHCVRLERLDRMLLTATTPKYT